MFFDKVLVTGSLLVLLGHPFFLGLEARELEQPVRIGLVETSRSAEALAAGAAVAIAEINNDGGVNRSALRLVRLEIPRSWEDTASLTARLVFEEKLVALIGPSDGAAAHLTAQIATKYRIPVITLSSEGSLTRAMDPWVFRAVPEDKVQAQTLLRWAFADPRGKRVGLAIPEGREGRQCLAALKAACRELGVRVVTVIRIGSRRMESLGDRDDAGSMETLDALLLWLDPEKALGFLRSLDGRRRPIRLLGDLRLDDASFLQRAPRWAEGLALPMLHHEPSSFPRSIASRNGTTWDGVTNFKAALGYDAVQAIAAAVERAGPKPELIREGLASGVTIDGKSGEFYFDRTGNRRGSIFVGVLKGGRLSRAP